MHRSLHIAVPSAQTDDLLEELGRFGDGVVGLSVQRGASVKPPGDVVTVQVLNRSASPVLEAIARRREGGSSVSIATAQIESINDPDHHEALTRDIDEAPWTDVRTALRQHTQLTANYLVLMALGGVVAAVALLSTSSLQPVALVAAAIIAPAFEPLAKLPLGVVTRRRDTVLLGLRSALIGYLLIALAGGLTLLLLDLAEKDMVKAFVDNKGTKELADPPAAHLVVSAAGALAGAIVITAYRLPLLAGPVVALHLVPAAALVGMAIAAGDGGLAVEGLGRLGLDVLFIMVAGLLVFGLKQRFVHRSSPL